MRLFKLILVLSLLLTLGAVTASAQQRDSDGDGVADSVDNCPNEAGPRENGGCPFVIIVPPNQAVDTDGDGLNDSDDNCPTVAGPRTNQGCPETPPTSPDPNDPPNREPDTSTPPQDTDGDGIPNDNDQCPQDIGTFEFDGCPPPPAVPDFNPPLLSNEACFVTTSDDYNARVRNNPSLEADHIGNLLAGVIYPAAGIVNTAQGQWIELAGEFQHLDFEATNGLDGYVSDAVVNHSDCPIIDNVQTLDVPINEYACTVITAFNWIFAFNYAPSEAIPEGTHPLAILNGDLELAGDLNNWTTSIHILNESNVEYMDYPGWASFPRTGGDCGAIGGNDAPSRVRDEGSIILFRIDLPARAMSDCNDNGIDDLDEFLPPDCYGRLAVNNSGQSANLIGWQDCDENGIHDLAQNRLPDCAIDGLSSDIPEPAAGQSPGSTEDELNLVCGAGANWWYVTETDENGEEYVPDDGEHRGCDWEND